MPSNLLLARGKWVGKIDQGMTTFPPSIPFSDGGGYDEESIVGERKLLDAPIYLGDKFKCGEDNPVFT